MLESGPLDRVGPAAAALLPEELMVTVEAPVRGPGDGKQSVGEVPVQSRPWVGQQQWC